ncbi:MAG: universal stress protein [Flammeovirgaceae bacterium]
MKKVLLPTDFSENAFHGISYGIQLLKSIPCEFYLLHTFYTTDTIGVLISVLDILEKEAKQVLQQEADKISATFPELDLTIHCVTQLGSLNVAVKEFIQQEDIDLVVMGTEGTSGIDEVFWGSHTSRLIREINCPILAVPNHYPFTPPKEVLIALDYEMEQKMNGQFTPLQEIMASYQPEFTFLNVLSPEDVYQATDLHPSWIKKYANSTKVIEYSEDVVKSIEKYISRWSTDMLVMVAHDYNFYEKLFHRSHTKKVVEETSVPVLVLHN